MESPKAYNAADWNSAQRHPVETTAYEDRTHFHAEDARRLPLKAAGVVLAGSASRTSIKVASH